ncbi:MAG: hypothetical protein J3R72DRAFT_460429 [Linnemannia gamsii]|nr:MAG: hypothetical protein J3R72DRAFT_460429 [Linnemannia gamsii]
MADNEQDHEQTPLLQDQDNNDEQEHNHHSERSHRDVVGNIRNIIENEIPNGHHITSSSAPKRVHALLPRLFTLINSLVDCANVEDEVITDEVVEYLCSLGQEVVYGLLRCIETMNAEGQRDVGRKRLLDRRAEVAQVAAAAVTKAFVDKDRMGTYCHVLTRPYYAVGEERNTAENAIEIAIRVHATDFISDIEVQRCVQALWTGLILQVEDDESRIRFIEYSGLRRSRHALLDWFDIGRLNVPKYQNNMKIALFVFFLAMYTFVVNNKPLDADDKPQPPNIAEWLMYVFVSGYIFEEFRLIFEGGTAFFLGSIWHWINIISYSMFMVSFSFRFTASYLLTETVKIGKYNDIAYDLQALLAVFLWVKTLSLLDGSQYFGTMVMVLQKMLKDGIMFFWLLAWFFIGFLQSMFALQKAGDKDFGTTLSLLIRGFLQDPDWDVAVTLDNKYGFWVFALYLFLTSIILLNLLVALFNSSYTNITDSSEKEYLALFTFKVFSYLKSPDQFPYAAPFNLIEVFFVIPFSPILSKQNYRSLNRVVMGVLFWIPVLSIAYGEQKRYLKLSSTNDDDDIQGGRRRYRHLTLDDVSVENLFMIDNDEDAVADSDNTAITNANAEEGNIADAVFTGWKSYGPANETFSDFQRRRVKEDEARAKAAAAAALEEAASSSSDEEERADVAPAAAVGSTVSAGPAVSEALVQALLDSIARMEERQKEMEVLLKQLTVTTEEAPQED